MDSARRDRRAKPLVHYKKSKSSEAFDNHYTSVHIPLAKKIPGLKKYDIPRAPGEIHLVATLCFESLASPEGKAAAEDLANFADGGADSTFSTRRKFDAKEG
jgi:uncharacterized protein (TIGR02118 family)